MKKESKVCWACGKATMKLAPELGKDWLKCSKCGATDLPNPTMPGRTALGSPYRTKEGRTHYHPAGVD